jgi:hypothetical protein
MPPVEVPSATLDCFFKKMFHTAEHLAVFPVYKSEEKLAERKRVDER